MTTAPLLLCARLRLLSRSRVPSQSSAYLRARAIGTSAASGAAPRSRLFTLRRLTALGLVSGAALGASIFVQDARSGTAGTSAANTANSRRDLPPTPLSELVRTYVVFAFCSVPTLVEWAPAILATLTAVPGVRQVTEAAVRATFFDQVPYTVLAWPRDDVQSADRGVRVLLVCGRRHGGGRVPADRGAARAEHGVFVCV